MENQKPQLDVDFDLAGPDEEAPRQELLMVATARMAPRGLTAAVGVAMDCATIDADPVAAIVAFTTELVEFFSRNVSGVAVCGADYKPEGEPSSLKKLPEKK